ncbi:MAG: hypothetical protein MJY47_04320 [Fibrobacter sp.]|nr:hypothetical protein [Fibrobacter sp.]
MRMWSSTSAIFALFLTILTLSACTDSDDYLFDENDKTVIEVKAEMTHFYNSFYNDNPEEASFFAPLEGEDERVKSDTIFSSDTLIFIGSILPDRYINSRGYFWTLDGREFSNESIFRKPIPKPGYHQVIFNVMDFFGDTIRDTLHVWVSNSPILDTLNVIPANQSQGLPPQGGIHFAWNGYDPDSLARVDYRFILEDSHRQTIIDTLIHNPYFTLHQKLAPLSRYTWFVYAINEYDFSSRDAIRKQFFTKGADNESGLQLQLYFPSRTWSLEGDISIEILDTNNLPISSRFISMRDRDSYNFIQALFAPLSPGKYKVYASTPQYPDFKADTIKVQMKPQEVFAADTIHLLDTISPTIAVLSSKGEAVDTDTLDFADTLKFVIHDGGGLVDSSYIDRLVNATLDNVTSLEIEGRNIFQGLSDTLLVFLPESEKSWNTRLLHLTINDLSKNVTHKTYYIKPTEPWPFSSNAEGDLDE